jgi:hypothetical protein
MDHKLTKSLVVSIVERDQMLEIFKLLANTIRSKSFSPVGLA